VFTEPTTSPPNYYGSVPGDNITLGPGQQIVSITSTSDGAGYWLAGADGGVFAFGDAQSAGSLPGIGVTPGAPIAALVVGPAGT
jgi:hypothetical protein